MKWIVVLGLLLALPSMSNADCKTANGWPAGKQCQPADNVGVRINATDKSLQAAHDAGDLQNVAAAAGAQPPLVGFAALPTCSIGTNLGLRRRVNDALDASCSAAGGATSCDLVCDASGAWAVHNAGGGGGPHALGGATHTADTFANLDSKVSTDFPFAGSATQGGDATAALQLKAAAGPDVQPISSATCPSGFFHDLDSGGAGDRDDGEDCVNPSRVFYADSFPITSSTAGIQQAIDACGEGSTTDDQGCIVMLPKGTRTITAGIVLGGLTLGTMQNGISLLGYGAGIESIGSDKLTGTALVWGGANGGTMLQVSGFNHHLADFFLDGNNEAGFGIKLTADNSASAPTGKGVIERIQIDDVLDTTLATDGWGISFESVGGSENNGQNDHWIVQQVQVRNSRHCLRQVEAQAIQNLIQQFECSFFTVSPGIFVKRGGLTLNEIYIGTSVASAVGIQVDSCATSSDFKNLSVEWQGDNGTVIRYSDGGFGCGTGNRNPHRIDNARFQMQTTATTEHTCVQHSTRSSLTMIGNTWTSSNADALRKCDIELDNPDASQESPVFMAGNRSAWNNGADLTDVAIAVTSTGGAAKRVLRNDTGRIELLNSSGSDALAQDATGLYLDADNDGVKDANEPYLAQAAELNAAETITGAWDITGGSLATATAAANDNDTSSASTAFVQAEIDDGDNLTDNCAIENDATPIPDSCVGDGVDGGGGGSIILDLADDAANESAAIVEIATINDNSGAQRIATEPSADKVLFDFAQLWPGGTPFLYELPTDANWLIGRNTGATNNINFNPAKSAVGASLGAYQRDLDDASNCWISEGATADGFELLDCHNEPTGSDSTWNRIATGGTFTYAALEAAQTFSGAQTFTGTVTNGAAGGAGMRSFTHATDCTALTTGVLGDTCYEQDVDFFYTCEPTAGGCDTAAEWRLTGDGGAGGGDSLEVEAGDNGGTFDAIDATAQLEDSGDINFVRAGAGAPHQISGEIRAGAVGTTEAAALDAGDTTTGEFADARVANAITVDEPGIAAAIARDTETCGGGACAVGTDDTVTLTQSAAPVPTVEGRAEWETDDDHLIVGDGATQVEFVPAEDMSGDATQDDAGAVIVANDSHDHTTTTVSGLDISADTNLAVGGGASLVRTDDTLTRGALTGEVTASADSNTTTIADSVTVATWTLDSPTITTKLNGPSVTALPGSPASGDIVIVTDDSAIGACDSAAGSARSLCRYNGTIWQSLGDGGGGGGGAFSDAADPIVQNTITKDVHVGDGAGALAGKLEVGGDADQPQVVIEGFSTQTDDVLIVQSDDDNERFTVSATGVTTQDGGATIGGNLTVDGTGTSDFDGAVTGVSFLADAHATPTLTTEDSTNADADADTSIDTTDNASNDATLEFKVEIAGTLTTYLSLDGLNDDIDIGAAGVQDITLTTDGTGDTEIVLPLDSISDEEINEGATFAWTGGHTFSSTVGLGASATATAPPADDNDTSVATTDYVQAELTERVKTYSATVKSPTNTDDFLLGKNTTGAVITITSINCIVDPAGTGESVVLTVNEYDGNGDTPAGIDGATTITCGNTNTADDGALSNAAVDAGDWIGVDLGTVTGTVDFFSLTVTYTVAN